MKATLLLFASSLSIINLAAAFCNSRRHVEAFSYKAQLSSLSASSLRLYQSLSDQTSSSSAAAGTDETFVAANPKDTEFHEWCDGVGISYPGAQVMTTPKR